ncbi:MAG TPA: tRNA (adenosine(37)-N6)-threonylcarbamoyltransferase complex dimerization subunit type 1 TsaB [Gammaproteobacteria bacterium]|nr:tRNA (adenosine(37)-N6)-threonylcarbamoyltransferase complex dimerization subunit type 1 TsaB [Gammaproteobacteria bacterium]
MSDTLLALETSTEACSVALCHAGAYFQRYELAPQQHAQRVMPMIDAVVAEAGITVQQVTGLAYAHGPGSFTGIRVGAGFIQGIAMGTGLRVAGVSTLAALAHRASREQGNQAVIASLDARMQEVYVAAYRVAASSIVEAVLPDCVTRPDAVALPLDAAQAWVGVGSGWTACDGVLNQRYASAMTRIDATLTPHALDVLMLAQDMFARGDALPAAEAMPVYLRDKVALTEAERAARKPST